MFVGTRLDHDEAASLLPRRPLGRTVDTAAPAMAAEREGVMSALLGARDSRVCGTRGQASLSFAPVGAGHECSVANENRPPAL